MDSLIEKLLADAEAALEAERTASQAAQPASPQTVDLAPVVEKAMTQMQGLIAEEVKKALESSRDGVGRQGGSAGTSAATLESDPVKFLVKKAGEVDFDDPYALTQAEKDALVGFWNATMWGDPNPASGDR